jgi:hypothetical protein
MIFKEYVYNVLNEGAKNTPATVKKYDQLESRVARFVKNAYEADYNKSQWIKCGLKELKDGIVYSKSNTENKGRIFVCFFKPLDADKLHCALFVVPGYKKFQYETKSTDVTIYGGDTHGMLAASSLSYFKELIKGVKEAECYELTIDLDDEELKNKREFRKENSTKDVFGDDKYEQGYLDRKSERELIAKNMKEGNELVRKLKEATPDILDYFNRNERFINYVREILKKPDLIVGRGEKAYKHLTDLEIGGFANEGLISMIKAIADFDSDADATKQSFRNMVTDRFNSGYADFKSSSKTK